MEKNKLSEKELQQLNELQTKVNRLIFSLGQVENQKLSIYQQLEEVQEEQKTFGKELYEKYGDGNINPETGEITKSE